MKADLVITNASIYTVDTSQSWAQAIAVNQGKIIFVGTDAGLEPYIDSGTVILNMDGKMVLPGFVDAHAHPSDTMDVIGNISLYSLGSLDAYKSAIADFINKYPDRDTYRGSGWADTLFPPTGPSKETLDALIPDRPVALVSYDGHSMWVNSVTLERAKITKDTPDPEGGRIERDPDTGIPNGTLRETAFKLIESVIPDYSIEERKNALLAYQDMAARVGITMSHDSMLKPESIAAFRALEADDSLKIRFRGSITMEPKIELKRQIETLLKERSKNVHLYFQINTAKIFVDGVVEGGTAYLFEPYAHKPDYHGDPIWDPEYLKDVSVALDKENIQLHYHVIGDAAAHITLDALQQARDANGKRDARHLITHLQLVTEEDIQRFRMLDVIGLPQPFWFRIDDYYWKLALPYLGKERADKQYPMKSFIDAGVMLASSSDFPVTVAFNPLIAIQMGMTRSRIDKKTKEVLWPEERVGLEDMIRSFTYNGAYANFTENEMGSIETGKQADFIVLDQNLFKIPVDEISKTKILMTFVDGKEIYRDAEFSLS